MDGIRRLLPMGYRRTAMWVALGSVALLALYLALSRVPLRVQISGGQLEVVRLVEGTPAIEAGSATTPLPLTVQMRMRLTSTSDWVNVILLPGSDILNTKTVETSGITTTARMHDRMHDRMIEIDQSIRRARAGDHATIVQDLTLAGVTEDQTLMFRVDKGCLGSLTVEIFNQATGVPILVERFVIEGCNPPDPEYLSVAVDVLTTTSPPLSSARPVEPDRGETVFWVEDETPPQIYVRDQETGRVTQVTDDLEFAANGAPSWSPDGTQILFPAGSMQLDHKLYIINADGSGLRQLTHGDSHDQEAEWSPDGQWIAFYRDCNLWRIRPDGSDEAPLLVSCDYCTEIPTWSPDSQQIAFLYYQESKARGIWVVNADGSDTHEVYHFDEPQPVLGSCTWSPDGRLFLCHYFETRGGPEKHLLVETDGSGQAHKVDWIADWWRADFWPRWGVEDIDVLR